jgi:hypothetical protein
MRIDNNRCSLAETLKSTTWGDRIRPRIDCFVQRIPFRRWYQTLNECMLFFVGYSVCSYFLPSSCPSVRLKCTKCYQNFTNIAFWCFTLNFGQRCSALPYNSKKKTQSRLIVVVDIGYCKTFKINKFTPKLSVNRTQTITGCAPATRRCISFRWHYRKCIDNSKATQIRRRRLTNYARDRHCTYHTYPQNKG